MYRVRHRHKLVLNRGLDNETQRLTSVQKSSKGVYPAIAKAQTIQKADGTVLAF